MRTVPSVSPTHVSLHKLIRGAISGFVATAPMSLFMATAWRLLPAGEQYHLPPRLITQEITERVGIEHHLGNVELTGLTILSHFGYGSLFGWIYALFEQRIPLHSALKGTLFGLAVWIGSYLGWLPALGILRPATRHPWRRNLLMIIAHVIWGVTLGETLRKLTTNEWK